jgi:RNA-directed DNA polymerase
MEAREGKQGCRGCGWSGHGPDGSERELGIPTVTGRLIQQALLQVLQPLIDPTFSEHSHGFRPGGRARDAVLAAQRYAQQGYRIVVDVQI